jgi:hypothetical protein
MAVTCFGNHGDNDNGEWKFFLTIYLYQLTFNTILFYCTTMKRLSFLACGLLVCGLCIAAAPPRHTHTPTSASTTARAGTIYEPLSFRTLRLYIPGRKPPQEVVAMNGRSIEIMGFMSALTQLEDITEFVLASSPPMNCFCHPPLRVNEVIFIQMNKGKKTDFKGGVVKVRGRLEVNANVQDEFADVMYTIYCDEVL